MHRLLHRYRQGGVGVGAKLRQQCQQLHFQFRAGTGAAHRTFEAQTECDFLELFAVLVLAVVNSVD